MNDLLIKFHMVCAQFGISKDEKQAIIEGFNKTSSKELTKPELIKAIETIAGNVAQNLDHDIWRKRVIAVIGATLRKNASDESIEYIKRIACRAANAKNFNKISLPALRRIYNEFRLQNKASEQIIAIIKEEELLNLPPERNN